MRRIASWVASPQSKSDGTKQKEEENIVSCEGYVVKRGKYVSNSWKQRYLVLCAKSLNVSYYESKRAYIENERPKGSFTLSSFSKRSFGGSTHPFGFKATGTNSKNNNPFELLAYVSSSQDLDKWTRIAENALQSARILKEAANSRYATRRKAIDNQSKTEASVESALKNLTEALAAGNSTCNELNNQSEILSTAERHLQETHGHLDRGKHLLNKMHRPFRSAFNRRDKSKNRLDPSLARNFKPTNTTTRHSNNNSDVSQLSTALDELTAQAIAIEVATSETRDQIERISESTDDAASRLSLQTSRTKALM